MNPCRGCLILLLIYALGGRSADSQILVEHDGQPFGSGSRAISMGGSYEAEAYDASSIYWNPAGLAFLEGTTALIEYADVRDLELVNGLLAASLRLGRNHAVALAVTTCDDRSRPSPGSFSSLYGVDLGYARALVPGVSLGLRVGIRYGKTASSDVRAISSSVGFQYVPAPEISYGIVYRGLGETISLDRSEGPMSLQRVQLHRELEYGLTMKFPSSRRDRILTVSLGNGKNFGEQDIWYKGGVELLLHRFLALRFGYRTGSTESGPRYGVGVNLDWFRLDYAIVPSKQSNRLSQVTTSITL